MLKRTFAGAFASFARAPATPGAGFAVPMPFDRDRGAPAFAGLARALAKAIAVQRRGSRIKRTMTELSGLNDHTLADIGIHRSQITGFAHAIAERPGTDPRQVGS